MLLAIAPDAEASLSPNPEKAKRDPSLFSRLESKKNYSYIASLYPHVNDIYFLTYLTDLG